MTVTPLAGRKTILPRKALTADVYTLALERTAEAMTTFDRVCVSFSGGKDSTAVLNVALEVAHSSPRFSRHLPLRAVFFDEECIPFETDEYVRRVAQRDDVALEWYCVPFKSRNACSRLHPWWYPWAPESEGLWARPLPPEAITGLAGFPLWPIEGRPSWPNSNHLLAPPHLGNCAQLMGIRAQESLTRNLAVSRRSVDNYIIHMTGSGGNIWKVYPVYDWSTEDVWTAPAVMGWDWNRAYDRQEMAGVSHAAQRCSPAFGEEPLQKLHLFAECFPEVWDKMTARVPGAGAAVRYAKTELYGFGRIPPKPAGIAWPEFVQHFLLKHPPEIRAQVAAHLASMIRTHYTQTGLPIAEMAPNPVTGLSWRFMLIIAMRGDFKERKKPQYEVDMLPDGTRPPRTWTRFAADLAAVIAEGRTAELGHPGVFPADPWALLPDYAREATSP
jgi:predicted phosphoadenosine phosphosulfate sulfurtransferase